MMAVMTIDVARDTHRLLRAFCDELARCGMQHACTSPGSRNTPIVLSLVREPRIRCWSHIDERCAGFFAVGAAKAAGRPVAVTCTSGTASANLAPAVIEAWWARVPLIVLTADRPAELRDNGAGQAIDQIKLYGDAVKWFCEVELPGPAVAADAAVRWMRTLACRAYWTASEGRPGPVHLNLPLREPLLPDGPLGEERFPGRADGRPWLARRPSRAGATSPVAAGSLPARGVIVCGRDERDDRIAAAAGELAAAAGWPLLADPLSRARQCANAIAGYDLLLRDEPFAVSVAPDLVVRVGDLPTSKPLRAWLAQLGPDTRQVALDPEGAWQDPAGVVAEVEPGDAVAALEALTAAAAPAGEPPSEEPDWLRRWTGADDRVGQALTEALARAGADGARLTEPGVAAGLGRWLTEAADGLGVRTVLFCAASMPIRDLELYLPARRPLPRVLSNRGANGIDGTISSAFGVAAAGDLPVVALLGDVALAHDIGGLLAARRLGLELTVVLIDNGGGGIFDFLAISGERDAFEEHIATPTGLDFAQVAAAFGLRHVAVRSETDLRDALADAIGSGAVTLIEVASERATNRELHATLAAAGLGALRPTAPAA